MYVKLKMLIAHAVEINDQKIPADSPLQSTSKSTAGITALQPTSELPVVLLYFLPRLH